MPQAKGLREISYFDCAGGGQVYVQGNYAYIAHMDAPAGTSILDISDPKHPRQVAHIEIPAGVHTHKVRVENGLMLVNWECPPPYVLTTNRSRAACWSTTCPIRASRRSCASGSPAGAGVHRFDFDGRYAYVTPPVDGYHLNIAMILDLKNPTKPEEVGRWWMPGQWVAGGEKPDEGYRMTWCHHVLRRGNRLYLAYWHAGIAILDIEDMSKPKLISRFQYSPTFAHPTHTVLPIPFPVAGRSSPSWPTRTCASCGPRRPRSCGSSTSPTRSSRFRSRPIQIEGIESTNMPEFSGCHEPAEQVYSTEIPVGLVPVRPARGRHQEPARAEGSRLLRARTRRGLRPAETNDVFQTKEGLMYVIDRNRGMHILERT